MHRWEEQARNTLRAHMRQQHMSFKTLQVRLEALGVFDSQVNLSNKVGRGKFSYAFFLQCMEAMNIDPTVKLTDAASAVNSKKP
ncbi:DUF6471 domain-containing protein [Paucibacter sp. R3-3]|uniref:DUF6471 domain-containing protein n=1 Tax=Roseateles agri TaxID=3098619 RepID=A0ABU5DET8_9BURK|nr:DUF6471 domain-containing protein [Paucibacter sp. R3-3]MDY0744788.1 DUF6471 domain-containing protein [Paucibacter sp. R3-3]